MERSGTTKVEISSDERRTEGERDERGERDMTKSRAQKVRKPVTIERLIDRAGKRVSRTNERVG